MLLESAALGVVQGVFEWLPVSSKTVVMLFSELVLGIPASASYVLGIALQGGTVLAAAIYMRKYLLDALLLRNKKLFVFLALATLATAVTGVPLYMFFAKVLEIGVVGDAMTVVIGVLLIAQAVLLKSLGGGTKGVEDVCLLDSVALGLLQGLAAVPGVSRSGITIVALIALGYHIDVALTLSFLASIPANLGATVLAWITSGGGVVIGTPAFVTALAVSAITGIAAIGFFIAAARRYGYRFALAVGVLSLVLGALLLSIR